MTTNDLLTRVEESKPGIHDFELGGRQVRAVDARELHTFLRVGKKFADWFRERIAQYDFVEGVDFQCFEVFPETGKNPSGGRPTKEYAITIDMAKELSMVERNEQGKKARAYFIECERVAREATPVVSPAVLEEITRTFGIVRSTIHKVTMMEKELAALPALTQAVTALTAIVQPSVPGVVIRHGRTAGAILKANGFTGCPRNLGVWFGNRLEAAGCRVEGRMDTGVCRARLFDPDKAEAWLNNGGRASVEMKLAERKGQGVLALPGNNVVSFGAHAVKDGRHLGYLFADACSIVSDMVKRGEVGEPGSPDHEYRLREAFVSVVAASGIRFPRPVAGLAIAAQ